MKARYLLSVIFVSLALVAKTSLAEAGEIADLGRDAETMLQSRQYVSAIENLRQAMRLAQDQMPLSVRKALFVSEEPQGFGIYKERGSDVFRQGVPLLVYIEPIGVGWKKQDDGYFHSLLAVDFEIRSPAGDILTGKRDFGRFAFTSHEQNTEIMTRLTFTLTGAKPGKYVLGVLYRDMVTGKSTTFDLPFSIQ